MAVLASLVLTSPPSRADDAGLDTFELAWVRGERTETCSDRATVANRVSQRLGRDVFSERAMRGIEAVLQHEGDVWEVHIYVRDAGGKLTGSRILTSHDATCTSIESAATLAIALAIDPDAALRPAPLVTPLTPSTTPPSPPPTVPPPAPSSQPLPTPGPRPLPSPPAPAPPRTGAPIAPCGIEHPCQAPHWPPPIMSATVDVRAAVAFGLLPATAPGVALATELPVLRTVHATAGLLYLPEQPARVQGGTFAFGMTAAWLGACTQPWQAPRASFSLCASALAGGIHSVVSEISPASPGERAWAAGAVGATFRARLFGPLEADIGADLVVPLTRYQFAITSGPTVFQQSAATGVAFAGVSLSFP